MKRTVSVWKNSDPATMAKQSEAAIMYAFQDAKEDILRMADMLRIIGYPILNTYEEDMDLADIKEFVRTNFSLEELTER